MSLSLPFETHNTPVARVFCTCSHFSPLCVCVVAVFRCFFVVSSCVLRLGDLLSLLLSRPQPIVPHGTYGPVRSLASASLAFLQLAMLAAGGVSLLWFALVLSLRPCVLCVFVSLLSFVVSLLFLRVFFV